MPGPPPNRSDDLSRSRDANRGDKPPITKGVAREVMIPRVSDKTWHPIAKRLWDAAKTSGQSDYYQNTDWAILYSLCEDMSNYKKSPRRSSQMLAAIMAGLSPLMLTEGDRRRARLELEKPVEEQQDAELYAIESYMDMLNDKTGGAAS